jgi:hypothetical protein
VEERLNLDKKTVAEGTEVVLDIVEAETENPADQIAILWAALLVKIGALNHHNPFLEALMLSQLTQGAIEIIKGRALANYEPSPNERPN